MRRFISIGILTVVMLLGTGAALLAAAYPQPEGYVSDFAGLLSPGARTSLETGLAQLQKETTAELAVVIITSLEGSSIEDYAVRLFEQWGIGKKGQDNGVLFITSVIDQKVRIEVGYGLEPVITDGRAGRILDNEVLPYFKQGEYEAGIVAGVAAIEKYVRDNTPPSVIEDNPFRNLFSGEPDWIMWPIILSIYVFNWMARTKSIWLGGVYGGAVGGVVGLANGSISTLVGFGIGGAILGLLLDYIMSKNYQQRTSSGQPTGWAPSYGGFRGSSGSGTSFGGFGGGHSGGGGASRGW